MKDKPKLVKNVKVVRLSKQSGSVKATLRRAATRAHDLGWKRFIIVADCGKEGNDIVYSRMSLRDGLYLLERGKDYIKEDFGS